jgi:hypothetical protein
VVDIYAKGKEMDDPLASTYGFFDEAVDTDEKDIG